MIKSLKQLICVFSLTIIFSIFASSFSLLATGTINSESNSSNTQVGAESQLLAKSLNENINKTIYNSLDAKIDTAEVLQTGFVDEFIDDIIDSFKKSLNKKENKQINNKTSGSVYITDSEYNTICCVVMREAGAGSYNGCAAVAQCILDAMLYEGKSTTYVLNNYGYQPSGAVSRAARVPVNQTVKNAVYAVFYQGYRVTSEPIIVYYAPAIMYSSWHESQIYVCSYDGNKFFKYRGT